MKYLPTGSRLRFTWAIHKEGTRDKEQLPDADMQVCLLQGRHIYPLQYTIDEGSVCGELPDTLPEGVYGFRAVWAYTKDNETRYKGSHVFDLFALTPKKDEVECAHDFMHIKFCSEAHEIPVPEKKPEKKSHGIPPAPCGPVKPCDGGGGGCSPLIPSYLLLHGLQGAPGADATANLLDGWGNSTGDGINQKFLSEQHELQQTKDAQQDASITNLQNTVEVMTNTLSDLEDTDARHDEAIDALASDLNQLIADGAEVAVSLTPSVFFVGQQVSMTAEMTCSGGADELTLTNESTYDTRSGRGTILHWEFNYTASESGVLSVAGSANIRGYLRLADAKAYSVLPIYYGTSATGNDYSGAIQLATAKRSPAGSYTMSPAAGDYLYWIVPATMSIGKVTLSGFDVPMQAAQSITYNGKAYKVYKTKNTYQTGNLTLVVS